MHEIVQWNQLSAHQKALVWQRIERITQNALETLVVDINPEKLERYLTINKVRYIQKASPYHWVTSLLNHLYHPNHTDKTSELFKHQDWQTYLETQCGIKSQPNLSHLSLFGYWNDIKSTLLTHSIAQYQLQNRARL